MKNSKSNKRTAILVIILLGLLVIAYKTIFMSSSVEPVDMTADEIQSGDEAIGILDQMKNINFDTSITENESFKSLRSIEIPLISLPVGRRNPFSSISGSN